MKTFIKTIFVCLFFSICCAPVYAQSNWAKGLAEIMFTSPAKGVAKTTGPQLYKWNKAQFQRVQSSLYGANSTLGHFAKQIAPTRSNVSTGLVTLPGTSTPTTYINPQQLTVGIDRAYAARQMPKLDRLILVRDTWATDALSGLWKEQQHYASEITAGRELRQQVLQVDRLTPEITAQLQNAVNGLNSETLRGYLTAGLQTGDLGAVYRDLTDYYMLDGNPVKSAYNYSLRHPHKPNLWMRRLMRSPLVESSLQQQAGRLLQQGCETSAQQAHFYTLLEQMNTEFEASLREVYASQDVLGKITFYRRTAHELENFINKHGRRPKSNTADLEEQKLAHDIGFALAVTAPAEPFASELKNLQDLWDANEPTWWTMEETLQRLEQFIQKANHYPRTLRLDPAATAEETELLDNLEHWHLTEGGPFTEKVRDLSRRYKLP